MKNKYFDLTLFVSLTVISLMSGGVVQAQIRHDGARDCLDLEAIFVNFANLPDNQLVQTQVTDIEMLGGSPSSELEIDTIRNVYESSLKPKSKIYDHSKTVQTGCDSVDTTYTNGRVDHYAISAWSQNSLTLVDQKKNYLVLKRINADTIETTVTTSVGICSSSANAAEGSVKITMFETWGNTPIQVAVSTNLLEKIGTVLQAPQLVCKTSRN